jgi:CspA family cold shock protein
MSATGTTPEVRERGTVRWFNAAKGYGFIEREGKESDIFVHYSGIDSGGYRQLLADQRVEYDVTKTDKGFQAINVKVVG